MDEQTRLTLEKIDQLLHFLPAFEQSNRTFIEKWDGFYPVYAPDVAQFVRLAGDPWWMDTGYQPQEAGQMLANDAIVQSASLDQIKTMLTFFVRGERFSDGHWGSLLENGRIQRLLHRLKILRKELDAA
ncbi:MAG: hypothetical protein H6667_03440 [Ardenticatenaceae bacterium]|nr:hypothetical protein [Ardenticatenaceae bacterium]MCB9443062.1 hypothetical protein [Ardenticatenaceae bacterium]